MVGIEIRRLLSLSLSPCFYFSFFCRSSSPLNSQLTELSISFGPKMIKILFLKATTRGRRMTSSFSSCFIIARLQVVAEGYSPFYTIRSSPSTTSETILVSMGAANLLAISSSNVMKQKFVAPITCLSSFRPFRWNRFLHIKDMAIITAKYLFSPLPPCLSLRRKK